MEISWLRNEP